MYYSFMGNYPITDNLIPDRIRLASGITKTNRDTFTDDDLQESGYIAVEPPPEITDSYRYYLDWNRSSLSWQILEYPYDRVKTQVDNRIFSAYTAINWLLEKHDREERLGIESTTNIDEIKDYVLKIIDIPKQESYPYYIDWPIPPHNVIVLPVGENSRNFKDLEI
jgi:hypothetical protein